MNCKISATKASRFYAELGKKCCCPHVNYSSKIFALLLVTQKSLSGIKHRNTYHYYIGRLFMCVFSVHLKINPIF